MKLAQSAVNVPEQRFAGGSKYRLLEPGEQFATIRAMKATSYEGTSSDKGENGAKVKNPAKGRGNKWDYVKIVPDMLIHDAGGDVEVSLEQYTLGIIEEGQIISPSAKYGSGEGEAIWFGFGGAGHIMASVGAIRDGELQELDTDKIIDRVVKVTTQVGGYVPAPVNRSFKPWALNKVLRTLNDGAYEFSDIYRLLFLYNLKEGYTVVTDANDEILADENNWEAWNDANAYLELMNRYRAGQAKFISPKGEKVRLKVKTVIATFEALTEVEAEKGGWHYKDGNAYLFKASASLPAKTKEDNLDDW